MTVKSTKMGFRERFVRTTQNRDRHYRHRKIFTQPSLTVPDMTMSMREILSRFTSGLPMDIGKEPIYHEDDYEQLGINPRSLDLTDIHELKENADAVMYEVKASKEKKAADKAKKDAENAKAWEEYEAKQKQKAKDDESEQH